MGVGWSTVMGVGWWIGTTVVWWWGGMGVVGCGTATGLVGCYGVFRVVDTSAPPPCTDTRPPTTPTKFGPFVRILVHSSRSKNTLHNIFIDALMLILSCLLAVGWSTAMGVWWWIGTRVVGCWNGMGVVGWWTGRGVVVWYGFFSVVD